MIVACITGVVTLVGVILSNSKSRVMMELKLDSLTEKVEKHNRLIERVPIACFTHSWFQSKWYYADNHTLRIVRKMSRILAK